MLAPSLFNTCMDWVIGRVEEQTHCGASDGNTKITDLVFADDAAIFTESLEVLVMAATAAAALRLASSTSRHTTGGLVPTHFVHIFICMYLYLCI